MKNVFLILLLIITSTSKGYCANIAEQTLSTSLGEVLEISKIIVEGVEYDVDAPLSNVRKRSTTRSATETAISLSPIQLKIHTNLSTPIEISAEFHELVHNENIHTFKQEDLSFSPKTIRINNPYDNIITDEFIPQVNVTSEAKKGEYTGEVIFTLGAI